MSELNTNVSISYFALSWASVAVHTGYVIYWVVWWYVGSQGSISRWPPRCLVYGIKLGLLNALRSPRSFTEETVITLPNSDKRALICLIKNTITFVWVDVASHHNSISMAMEYKQNTTHCNPHLVIISNVWSLYLRWLPYFKSMVPLTGKLWPLTNSPPYL